MKLSLKWLIFLEQKTKYSEGFYDEKLLNAFFEGLNYFYDATPFLPSTLEELIEDLSLSLGASYTGGSILPKFKFEELYKIAVGELGIDSNTVYDMTPYEIQLAYEGYLRKRELDINSIIVAIKKAKNNSSDFFTIVDNDVKESTKEEREKTFKQLKID